MFWHLAGEDEQAARDRSVATNAFHAVRVMRLADVNNDDYRANLGKMQQMLDNEMSGRWGVWKGP